jgi:hypothetical protein
VPADDKPTARLIVARIILEELKKLNVDFPVLADEEIAKFDSYKQALENE